MPIQIQCPNCKARMKAPDGSEGRKAKCPRCGTLIPILSTGDSPDGGEEDVKSGDDAGLFSSTKKPGKPTSKTTDKSDFDLGDETAKPIRKGRKIVEEDEEEEEAKPVRKGRKIVEEDDNVTSDDDDDEDSKPMGLQDDDEDEEEDRPRKKKKKKRRRRSRAEDVDPELIEKGWTFVKQAFGAGVIAFCCCGPVAFVGVFLSIAAIGTGIAIMSKGDSGNGTPIVALGVVALGFNVLDILGFIFYLANGGPEGFEE